MTGDASTAARLLGTLGAADGEGVVRVQDRVDADIGDGCGSFGVRGVRH